MSKPRALVGVFHYIMPDVVTALRERGWDVELLGDQDTLAMATYSQVIQAIATKPDLFITLNAQHMDQEGTVAAALRDHDVSTIVWYVDSPLDAVKPWCITRGALGAPEDVTSSRWQLLCIDPVHVDQLTGMGYGAQYFPHWTTSRFYGHEVTLPKEIVYPISFIGNISSVPMDEMRTHFFSKNPQMVQYVDGLLGYLWQQPRGNFDHHIAAFNHTHGITKTPFLGDTPAHHNSNALLRRYISSMMRLKLLQMMGTKDAHAFGCPGYEVLDGITCHDRVNYDTQTPSIYSQSAINLNQTHYQFESAFNQRVLDVLAGGDFILTDETQALHEHFVPGESVATYRTLAELGERLQYYIQQPEERARIAKAGQAVVREHYQFEKRVEALYAHINQLMRETP